MYRQRRTNKKSDVGSIIVMIATPRMGTWPNPSRRLRKHCLPYRFQRQRPTQRCRRYPAPSSSTSLTCSPRHWPKCRASGVVRLRTLWRRCGYLPNLNFYKQCLFSVFFCAPPISFHIFQSFFYTFIFNLFLNLFFKSFFKSVFKSFFKSFFNLF